jgi:prepilin-type N-terminal cleavage/methylation domain-containing protein
MTHTTRPGRLRGFSLVEVIVVIVILAVVAAAAVPRLTAWSGRHVRAAALAAGDLLSAAARRETLAGQATCVIYDAEGQRLVMLSLVRDENGGASWRQDHLAPMATLADVVIESVDADGAAMDPMRLRLDFTPGVRRPSYRLVLRDGQERWAVELPSHADQAVVSAGTGLGLFDQSIDLDANGAGSATW